MRSSIAAAAPYAAFYGALFLAIGIQLPYWPIWLGGRGLTPEQIGLLLALTAWVKVGATPLIAQISDRLGQPRTVLAALVTIAAACFALFFFAQGFWPILLVSLPMGICFSAMMPISESLTMAAVMRENMDYGRVRLWGSLAFVVGVLGAGGLLTDRYPDLILVMILGVLVAGMITVATLPRQPATALGGVRLSPGVLLRDRHFLLFLATATLLQASHATYYAFSAIHWRAAELSGMLIGALWAEGVIAEVIFFAVSAPIYARTGPVVLLLIAGLAGMVRWTVLGITTDLTALIAVQLLHGATFGAAHFGAMHLVTRAAPPNLATTAQGLYSAAAGGIGIGLALLLAGWLYGINEGSAFLAMAGLSLGGAVLAVPLHRWKRQDSVV
jgi:PPP family 3-phenylpropionic acid transporter